MKILNRSNNYPPNSLAKAIQSHCNNLLSSLEENNINQLEDLDKKIQDYTAEGGQKFRSKPNDFKGEVHSYLTFEVYNLLFKENTLLISIVSRKTEFETAFSKYDLLVASSEKKKPVYLL